MQPMSLLLFTKLHMEYMNPLFSLHFCLCILFISARVLIVVSNIIAYYHEHYGFSYLEKQKKKRGKTSEYNNSLIKNDWGSNTQNFRFSGEFHQTCSVHDQKPSKPTNFLLKSAANPFAIEKCIACGLLLLARIRNWIGDKRQLFGCAKNSKERR